MATTPPLIVRDGELKIVYTTPTGTVDLSCYAYAVDAASDVEELDIGTFCTPNATDQGKVTQTLVVSLLWSEELYTILLPYIGKTGHLAYKPVPGATAKALQADVKYSVMPWGRFEIGARVEVDLPLAVLTPITYGVVV